MIILAEGNCEGRRVEALAQRAACIYDGEHFAPNRLLLPEWQHDAADRAVIAQFFGRLALHTIEQTGLAIDPESKAASAGDLETDAIPSRGSLGLRANHSNRRAAKLRPPVCAAGQIAVVDLLRAVRIELNVSVRILMPTLHRAVAVGLLYIERLDLSLGHVGAAVQVLDITQASGLRGNCRRALRVALFIVLPGGSAGGLIKVLENVLSRRLPLCGKDATVKETKEKGGEDKTY